MPTTAAAAPTTPSLHDAETAVAVRGSEHGSEHGLDRARQLNGVRSAIQGKAGWMSASDLLAQTDAEIVDIDEPVASLFAKGGPRRGDIGVVVGSTSLILMALARPSRQGRWCAVVGATGLGLAAAHEAGVDLARLVLIPHPGSRWEQIVAALLDTFAVVVTCPPEPVAATVARRLAAITRRQQAVLIVSQRGEVRFEGARWWLRVVSQQWQGIEDGSGHLRSRQLDVEVVAKTPAVRRTTTIWLPGNPVQMVPVVERQVG